MGGDAGFDGGRRRTGMSGERKCPVDLGRYRAMVFDFDMTLADTSHVIVDLLKASLDKYGLLKYFQYVLGGDEVKTPKPDPEGILRMRELFGVEKEELLYVGDSLVDEKAAEAAGVDFCAMLLGGTRAEQFQEKNRARAFHSWEEVSALLAEKESGGRVQSERQSRTPCR